VSIHLGSCPPSSSHNHAYSSSVSHIQVPIHSVSHTPKRQSVQCQSIWHVRVSHISKCLFIQCITSPSAYSLSISHIQASHMIMSIHSMSHVPDCLFIQCLRQSSAHTSKCLSNKGSHIQVSRAIRRSHIRVSHAIKRPHIQVSHIIMPISLSVSCSRVPIHSVSQVPIRPSVSRPSVSLLILLAVHIQVSHIFKCPTTYTFRCFIVKCSAYSSVSLFMVSRCS